MNLTSWTLVIVATLLIWVAVQAHSTWQMASLIAGLYLLITGVIVCYGAKYDAWRARWKD